MCVLGEEGGGGGRCLLVARSLNVPATCWCDGVCVLGEGGEEGVCWLLNVPATCWCDGVCVLGEGGGGGGGGGEGCWLVACLTSQQHASVSQGRICSDNWTCCHTEIELDDHTCRHTQPQHTVTGPTSPSADNTTPGQVFVCWLLNIPATFECISGTVLLRQFYVLPH